MKTSLLIVDNYDSFTYNLVQECAKVLQSKNADFEIKVERNDDVQLKSLEKCTHILISPGPGTPENAGMSQEIVRKYAGVKPILGVCLGHQVIAQVAGAKVERADKIVHGKSSPLILTETGKASKLFKGIENATLVARYHSLIVKPGAAKNKFKVLAVAEDADLSGSKSQEIMALEYSDNCYGVQFHPESILTQNGFEILKNFLL